MLAMIVAGCTASQSDPASPAPPGSRTEVPQGLFSGSTSTGRQVTGIVLDDGTYYVLYSSANNPGVIAGAVQGTGSALNGSFTSTNGRDINLEGLGVLSASVSASYQLKASLNGTIAYPTLNQSPTFTSVYDARDETAPSLAAIAGTYAGRAGSSRVVEDGTVTISLSGVVMARGESGCTSSGRITPRAHGNAYDLTFTFGGAPCLYPQALFTGGAYYDAATRRVYGVALNASRDAGFIFSGVKP